MAGLRITVLAIILFVSACGSDGTAGRYDPEATRACLKDLGANVTAFNDGGEASGDVDRAFGFGFPDRMDPKTLQFPSGDL